MKNAVVTGANGFVGAALCYELVKNDVEVYAVCRNEASNLSRLVQSPKLHVVFCAQDQYKKLPELISDGVDTFYHFAWEGSSGSIRGNSEVQLENVRCSCEAVRFSKLLGCNKFIFASSIMEYEIQNAIKTEAKIGINTIYSSAKVAASYMCQAIANDLDIGYCCGIISNIYGPGETSPRLVNSVIRKLICDQHCSFSSGIQLYDFIYIDDAVRAFYMIGEKGKNNRRYYIGSKPKPLKNYLLEIRDVINPESELGFGELPQPVTVLNYDEFNVNLLYQDSGFKAEIPFKEGILRTVNWIKGEENRHGQG